MARENSDNMAGRIADGENLVANGWAGLDRGRAKALRRELPVHCVDVVHHEVEWRGTADNLVLAHEDEVRAAAQLQNAGLHPRKTGRMPVDCMNRAVSSMRSVSRTTWATATS